MLTEVEREALYDAMLHVPDTLHTLIDDLYEVQLTTAYVPGEWTIAQNVHHLADSQMNAFIRFKLLLYEDHPTLKTWQQDDWAEAPDSQDADVASSLAIVRGVHTRWVTLMRTLDEAAWTRGGTHPEIGQVTPGDLLAYYGRHGDVHVEQIGQVLAAMRRGYDG